MRKLLYTVLNWQLEKRIEILRPKFLKMLQRQVAENQNKLDKIREGDIVMILAHTDTEMIKESLNIANKRLSMDRKYIYLRGLFAREVIRRYMINSNYLKYIQTVLKLSELANIALISGTLFTDTDIFIILQKIESSFDSID